MPLSILLEFDLVIYDRANDSRYKYIVPILLRD